MTAIRVILGALALVLSGFTPSFAKAQVEPAAHHIPTSAFASPSNLARTRLSRDGNLLAFSIRRDDQDYVSVHSARTLDYVSGVNLGEDLDFNWFRWAGNRRVLISMRGELDYPYTQLYMFDIDKEETFRIGLSAQGLRGDDILYVDPDGDYVLLSLAEEVGGWPAVWQFDLGNPDAKPRRVENTQLTVGRWIADNEGVVRIAYGWGLGGRLNLRYRASADDQWRTVLRAEGDDTEALQYWDFINVRAGSDIGLAIALPEGAEYSVLQEFNFATGEPGDIVHRMADADIRGAAFDKNGEMYSLFYSDDERQVSWINPELEEVERLLQTAMPDARVRLIDWADDHSRFLVLHSAPDYPGALYLYDAEAKQLDEFAPLRPEIDRAKLGPKVAFSYEARDGTQIRSYLTLPPTFEQGRRFPLIVMPHGGPYGVRDLLTYDDWSHLLANRGYVVVQPNYRGSSGYGESFEELGDAQIGRAMQDDLDDVVAALTEAGVVDANRVCIVGASYGGYAALWGAIRNPEIYRCAASWAGVTHFDRQLIHDRNYLYRGHHRRWKRRIEGDEKGFDLDDVSPAVQVERLTRPVLLAHGEEDTVVPFSQFEVMQRRGELAGAPIETLVLEESRHGFANPEDEQAWYDALVAFLAKHNPAD